MSKEKYNQIIDGAYDKYLKGWENAKKMQKSFSTSEEYKLYLLDINILSKEEFINRCKTDETWDTRIEERELTLEERINLIEDDNKILMLFCENPADEWLEGQVNEILAHRNIPTKLITVTYKNEKIEIYG